MKDKGREDRNRIRVVYDGGWDEGVACGRKTDVNGRVTEGEN